MATSAATTTSLTSPVPRRPYDLWAGSYDALRWLYGWGAMERSLDLSVASIPRGARVLLAGCGSGREARSLLQRGAHLTLLDGSSRMLERARQRLATDATQHVQYALCDLQDFDSANGPYDYVVANYFLNVFGNAELPQIIARLAELLAPNGHLIIADFAPLKGPVWHRGLQWIHHAIPMSLFYIAGGCSLHEVRRYEDWMPRDLVRHRSVDVRAFRWGPRWYRVLEFQKQAP